ncbi:MAG: hypothetical protein C0418_02040 [Coriobacteriaceae bacterium]|nr:hypothetical protein [Coriobacteriaceae bacterium]
MDLLAALVAGLALAGRFNPIASVIGAAACATLLADEDAARSRWTIGLAVLLGAWLLGDGLRVLARTRDLADGVATLLPAGALPSAQWTALGFWALGSLLLGYALPAWAGVFAGRRVTHGIDWAVAATVAVGVSIALTALARTAAGV